METTPTTTLNNGPYLKNGMETKNNGPVQYRESLYIPSFNHLSSLTLIRPLIPRSFSSYSTSSNHLSFSHPLTIIRSPKVIPCSFAFLCVSVAPIYNTLIWRLRVTVLRKDVEKWGEGNLILEPKNRMLIRIKLVSLSWPAMQLNKLLKINLKQSGSILLLPLADDAPPSTAVPGGRMWAYSQRESLPETIDISATYSPPRQELIRNLLSRLSEIESTVNALSQTVDSELQHLDAPPFVDSSSFPLHHLFLECHRLDADLEKVKSKISSVATMKSSIKGQLVTIGKKLDLSKLTWKEKREKLCSNRIEHTWVKHSTGKRKCFLRYFLLLMP